MLLISTRHRVPPVHHRSSFLDLGMSSERCARETWIYSGVTRSRPKRREIIRPDQSPKIPRGANHHKNPNNHRTRHINTSLRDWRFVGWAATPVVLGRRRTETPRGVCAGTCARVIPRSKQPITPTQRYCREKDLSIAFFCCFAGNPGSVDGAGNFCGFSYSCVLRVPDMRLLSPGNSGPNVVGLGKRACVCGKRCEWHNLSAFHSGLTRWYRRYVTRSAHVTRQSELPT